MKCKECKFFNVECFISGPMIDEPACKDGQLKDKAVFVGRAKTGNCQGLTPLYKIGDRVVMGKPK